MSVNLTTFYATRSHKISMKSQWFPYKIHSKFTEILKRTRNVSIILVIQGLCSHFKTKF